MALKTDRYHIASYIDYFMNEVAERGGVVCQSTVGSGSAMDQSAQLATYAANPSGKVPLGILMSEVRSIDLTRQHRNWHQEEVTLGEKVTIWSKGYVVTNLIVAGQTVGLNKKAYLGHSGYLAGQDVIGGGSDLIVGRWLSSKDEDGYAKVDVNLPN
jgi:hypothetical protein